MGKFDIDKSYENEYVPKMIDLCNEILCEIESDSISITGEQIRERFKNSKKTGIIDKLNKLLSYDIEKNTSDDSAQKFAMMQILKLIYMIDKKGCLKIEDLSKWHTPVHIIDILSKPNLDNILISTTNKTVDGNTFISLIEVVGKKISDLAQRADRIYAVNHKWEQLNLNLFYYIISDKALAEKNKFLSILKNLYDFLDRHLLDLIEKYKPTVLPYQENVFETFYNLLCTHFYRCLDYGKYQINNELMYIEQPTEEYIEQYKTSEFHMTEYEIIDRCISELKSEIKHQSVKTLLYLLSYGKGVEKNEIGTYIYALEKTKPLINLIYKYHKPDLSKGIDVSLLVSIVQEIIYTKNQKDKLSNKHHNHNSNKKSFLRSLLDIDNADAILVEAWNIKIQNRLIINFGMREHLIYKRKIESNICKIKDFIYSHKSLTDIEAISDLLLSAINKFISFNCIDVEIEALMIDCNKVIQSIYQEK